MVDQIVVDWIRGIPLLTLRHISDATIPTEPGMMTGRRPYLSKIAPAHDPPMYKKKAYRLTTHAVCDLGSAASWFSPIQASRTPIVLSIPIDGIMAHQAPSTTDQARQPPSGNSPSMPALGGCRVSSLRTSGEAIMY